MLEIGFIISSFFAGLLTFLAPCTLPLVPAYLSFISGVDQDALKDPERKKSAQRKIIINGILFILGFSLIFIIFGTLAGFVGQSLVPFRIWLTRIGGAFIIIFGLFMLGAVKIPFLSSDKRITMPKWLPVGKPGSSFLIGGTFALGWTPCVGPILGSILLLASTSTTGFQGALLLSVFSLGLAIPFIVLAFAFSRATRWIEKISVLLKWVSIIGGIFLVGLGVLLLTNQFGLIVQYGYILFDFIHFDRLFDFL